MSKKAKPSVAELLPEYSEAVELTQKVRKKDEKKFAKKLMRLTKALDESVDCHAILLATNIIDNAKKGETQVTHRLRENFVFKGKKPTGTEKEFAMDCLNYVAKQLAGAMEPAYDAQAYPAREVEATGFGRADFAAYPVEAIILATWQGEAQPGGVE